jgi:glutathione S-transferase
MKRTNTPSLVLCELADAAADGPESYSPFCLKAHRALKLAGLPYERRHGSRPADFRAHNPTGQVPVLLVDGEPIGDSTKILERVDALTGALTRGLDARGRAEAWLWEDFSDTALNGYLVAARWADERNWPVVRDAYFGAAPWLVRAAIAPRVRGSVVGALVARDVWRAGPDACWARFAQTLDQLEARSPASGFWLGPLPSVADLGLFAQLHSLRTRLTRPQADAVAARPALSAYLDRVDAATLAAEARPAEAPHRAPAKLVEGALAN